MNEYAIILSLLSLLSILRACFRWSTSHLLRGPCLITDACGFQVLVGRSAAGFKAVCVCKPQQTTPPRNNSIASILTNQSIGPSIENKIDDKTSSTPLQPAPPTISCRKLITGYQAAHKARRSSSIRYELTMLCALCHSRRCPCTVCSTIQKQYNTTKKQKYVVFGV